MQIGEGISIALVKIDESECIFCGEAHDEIKQEKIEPVAPTDKNWQRKSMKGIFERKSAKNVIYPNDSFPPSYSYQGHHCLALSAFTFDSNSSSPRDRNATLNHFLKKVEFFPNREQNCIGLPARRSYGAFKPFWEALEADKPLQLHGPGHDEKYFLKCNRLIAQLVDVISDQEICEENSQKEMEDKLKKLISQAENYAFIKLCSLDDSGWDLHKAERELAESIYTAPTDESFEVRGARNIYRTEKGKGNVSYNVKYPKPSLDTGPF